MTDEDADYWGRILVEKIDGVLDELKSLRRQLDMPKPTILSWPGRKHAWTPDEKGRCRICKQSEYGMCCQDCDPHTHEGRP
jgi:hypothetical protein